MGWDGIGGGWLAFWLFFSGVGSAWCASSLQKQIIMIGTGRSWDGQASVGKDSRVSLSTLTAENTTEKEETKRLAVIVNQEIPNQALYRSEQAMNPDKSLESRATVCLTTPTPTIHTKQSQTQPGRSSKDE